MYSVFPPSNVKPALNFSLVSSSPPVSQFTNATKFRHVFLLILSNEIHLNTFIYSPQVRYIAFWKQTIHWKGLSVNSSPCHNVTTSTKRILPIVSESNESTNPPLDCLQVNTKYFYCYIISLRFLRYLEKCVQQLLSCCERRYNSNMNTSLAKEEF